MRTITKGAGSPPRYLQVKQHLQNEIRKGRITGQVPPERELAQQYDLAYMTVRRAVSELVAEGLLYRKLGKGTFVCQPGQPARRTRNLGFVLSPVISDGISNAFFAKVFLGMEREAREQGHSLIYSSQIGDLPAVGKSPGNGQLLDKVDGVIAACLNDAKQVLALSRSLPVVLIDDVVEGSGIPSIRVDNVAASRQATLHLIKRGHRRVGYIGGAADSIVGRERIGGYVQALVESGLETTPSLIVQAAFDFDSGYRGAQQLLALAEPPTGLFCGNDVVAFGAMKRLREAGRAVPGDIGVVGFDDIDAAAQVHPALTTVAVPKERIGQLAVRTLLGMVEAGVNTLENPRIVVETRFIERESC